VFGAANDTLQKSWKTGRPEDFGSVQLQFRFPQSDAGLVMALTGAKGKHEWQGPVPAEGAMHFRNLRPGEYEVRVWEDRTANGVWDQARFSERRQPERIWVYPQKVQVRANWEVAVRWEAD
jgi:hypothetical protein